MDDLIRRLRTLAKLRRSVPLHDSSETEAEWLDEAAAEIERLRARDEHLVLIARALGDALSAHEQLNDEAGWSPLDLAQLRKAAQAVFEMGGEP